MLTLIKLVNKFKAISDNQILGWGGEFYKVILKFICEYKKKGKQRQIFQRIRVKLEDKLYQIEMCIITLNSLRQRSFSVRNIK